MKVYPYTFTEKLRVIMKKLEAELQVAIFHAFALPVQPQICSTFFFHLSLCLFGMFVPFSLL